MHQGTSFLQVFRTLAHAITDIGKRRSRPEVLSNTKQLAPHSDATSQTKAQNDVDPQSQRASEVAMPPRLIALSATIQPIQPFWR
jgi:hypothetical protein